MARSRLRLALADGDLALPDAGDIAVLGSATDLEAIPRERSVVLETFRPDHDRLGAAGYRTVTELTSAATRARVAALARSNVTTAAAAEVSSVTVLYPAAPNRS
ncbi:MAG: MFS transporter, partial [Pseudomonadota bacterium]